MYYIDFEAFQYNGEFIIKELCIRRETKVIYHKCFKQPFYKYILHDKDFKSNTWLSEHRHHLQWEQGDVKYEPIEVISNLIPAYATVMMRGDEKIKYLKYHIPTLNIKETDRKLIGSLKNCCKYHYRPTTFCAYSKLLSIL